VVDIVVLGSLNMDLVIKAPRAPDAGETIRGYDFQMIPGGKGANQAAAAAKLGGQVAMVGRVGADAFGPVLIDNMARQGVDTGHIAKDPEASTGVAVITVDDTGENRIVISAGANGRVNASDVDRAEDLMRDAQFLIVQLEIPLQVVDYAMDQAARHALKVILNPAPATSVSPQLLGRADYLVPNETETKLLTGFDVSDLTSAERAARQFLSYGAGEVIITLGEKGALRVTKAGATHVPAREVKAVDTTAAGDAFIGGLVVALVKGFTPDEAVRYAACAGTLAVTKFGAQTSLPSAEEVDQFYRGEADIH
jgi:ribokinase